MKTQDMLPWSALAALPAVVCGYLLALTEADCVVERHPSDAAGAARDDGLVANVRTFKRCADILHSHAERADLGARIGALFDEHAWLQSFRCQIDLEWAIGDEGQIYESSTCVVSAIANVPDAPLHAEVQGGDGMFDPEAAEAAIEAFFDEYGHDLALLLRDGTDAGTWDLSLRRESIEAELAQRRPSGKAIWNALFPDSPGLVSGPTASSVADAVGPRKPIERHPLASFAEIVQAQLSANGYEVHQGPKGQDPEQEGRWWFSWSAPGMADVEVGATVDTELEAWLDALQHRLANSEIPLHLTV